MFVKVPRNVKEVELGYVDSQLDEISYLVTITEVAMNNEIVVTVFGDDEVITRVGSVDSNYFEFTFNEDENTVFIVRVSLTDVSINVSIDKK